MLMTVTTYFFIARFGPVVCYWTMRFEGRHKLFKRLTSVMGNYINIPKSLANRYQEYQCYYLLNNDNYFRQETVIGKSESSCIFC